VRSNRAANNNLNEIINAIDLLYITGRV